MSSTDVGGREGWGRDSVSEALLGQFNLPFCCRTPMTTLKLKKKNKTLYILFHTRHLRSPLQSKASMDFWPCLFSSRPVILTLFSPRRLICRQPSWNKPQYRRGLPYHPFCLELAFSELEAAPSRDGRSRVLERQGLGLHLVTVFMRVEAYYVFITWSSCPLWECGSLASRPVLSKLWAIVFLAENDIQKFY